MENIHIICVDDDPKILEDLNEDLNGIKDVATIEGYNNTEEALERITDLFVNGDHPAVIISKHVMPGMSGIDFFTAIERDGRFDLYKKVLITDQATHQDTIRAINEADIDYYFEKPWDETLLFPVVRRLMTKYIMERGLDYKRFRNYLDQETLLRRLRRHVF